MTSDLVRRLGLAAVLLVFAAALASRADADLWGHVRFGADILAAGHLSAVDPYSFTQDTPWLNHEWLSEAQMGAAYLAAGPAGLQILKATIITLVTALIWTALSGVRLIVRVIVFLVLFIGTIHMWATIRPQLWSLVCFALMCRMLTARSARARWWLPLLFAFWANCHGGWVAGLGVLGVWAVASVVIRPAEWRTWLTLTAASAAATLCNPYGWRLWEFVLRTVRVTRPIEEWQPLWMAPGLNWLPWTMAVVAILWFAISRRSGRMIATACALGVLGYGAVRVQRVESLFVVSAAILLAPWLAEAWPSRESSEIRGDVGKPVFLVATTGAALLAGVLAWRSLGCIAIFGAWVPERATAHLLDGAAPGRLVTFFDWGEYAIWHFGPRLKVSMDGRRETVYSDARLAEHDAIVAGSAAGLATLAGWRAEYVWLPARSVATKQWLVQHGYRLEADGPKSFLAVRADLPPIPAKALPRPADCFPQ